MDLSVAMTAASPAPVEAPTHKRGALPHGRAPAHCARVANGPLFR